MLSKEKLLSRYIDKTFGKLHIVSFDHNSNRQNFWNCQCNCGNTCVKSSQYLRTKRGSIKSCGHCTTYRKFVGIYVIENKTNGKYYLGSSIDINGRWQDHRKHLRGGYHHSIALQRAWDKYGEESFEFKILEETDDPTSLVELEQTYLDSFPCQYNSSRWASSGSYSLRKPVCQYDLEGNLLNTFESIKEAERQTCVKESSISSCCKRKIRKNGSLCKTAGGFLWCYEGDTPDKYQKRNYSSHEKRVNQYDLDGKFVATFVSAAEATKQMGLPPRRIARVISRKDREYLGFLWCYASELTVPTKPKKHYVQKICLETGKILAEYVTCKEAAESLESGNAKNINAVIQGKRNKCGGFSWKRSDPK